MHKIKAVYRKGRGSSDKKQKYLFSSYGNLVIERMMIKGHV